MFIFPLYRFILSLDIFTHVSIQYESLGSDNLHLFLCENFSVWGWHAICNILLIIKFEDFFWYINTFINCGDGYIFGYIDSSTNIIIINSEFVNGDRYYFLCYVDNYICTKIRKVLARSNLTSFKRITLRVSWRL